MKKFFSIITLSAILLTSALTGAQETPPKKEKPETPKTSSPYKGEIENITRFHFANYIGKRLDQVKECREPFQEVSGAFICTKFNHPDKILEDSIVHFQVEKGIITSVASAYITDILTFDPIAEKFQDMLKMMAQGCGKPVHIRYPNPYEMTAIFDCKTVMGSLKMDMPEQFIVMFHTK